MPMALFVFLARSIVIMAHGCQLLSRPDSVSMLPIKNILKRTFLTTDDSPIKGNWEQ